MRHEVLELSDGWTGTDQTVSTASRLIQDSLVDPVVVTAAQNIVRHTPERDKMAEVRAVSNFVRRNVRYTNESVETLKTPRLMLDEIQQYGKAVGDCDDHVILWCALLRAVGTKVRMKVISQRQDGYANHIYAQVYVPKRGWITDDTIVKNKPLGWEIPSNERTNNKLYPLNGLGGSSMAHEFWAGGVLDAGQDWLPKPMSFFGDQVISEMPSHRRGIKRGGMIEIREDGSVGGVGDVYEAGMGDIFDVVGSIATKAMDVAKSKIDAKINKALNPPTMPAKPPPSAGGLFSNPIVMGIGILGGGFVAWKLLEKFDII